MRRVIKMGLFNAFGKNKERIEALEKEKQALIKEMQIKEEEYHKKMSQYESVLNEKENIIEIQQKKLRDFESESTYCDENTLGKKAVLKKYF